MAERCLPMREPLASTLGAEVRDALDAQGDLEELRGAPVDGFCRPLGAGVVEITAWLA